MDNEQSSNRLTAEGLRVKKLQRKWLLGQRNHMGYGLSLGAVLLFFGIGGGQTGLLFIGGLAVALGLYFYFRFEKERKAIEEELREYYPDGIPGDPGQK